MNIFKNIYNYRELLKNPIVLVALHAIVILNSYFLIIIIMSSNLNRNQHSVYILTYHLVLVIKYRRKVIDEDIF